MSHTVRIDDSTYSHEFASQFGLANFLYAKNTQKRTETVSPARVFISIDQRPATKRVGNCITVDRQRHTEQRQPERR